MNNNWIRRHRLPVILLIAAVAIGIYSSWTLVGGEGNGRQTDPFPTGTGSSVVNADDNLNISLNAGVTPAVKRALPAVVNISSTKIIEQAEMDLPIPFFERFFGPMPQEREAQSLGSGVIVGEKGHILTNDHVVRKAKEIKVRIGNEQVETEAEIVGRDPKTDLALIKIQTDRELPVLPFADSNAVEVGGFALAIGNPFGLRQTVTFGIISAKGRGGLGIETLEDFIQTDASINPGNSGGALVNLRGELIGINTAIVGSSGGNQGVGFAVPSNMAKSVMDQLLENGRVIRGWMGVRIQSVTPPIAEGLGLEEPGGALISSVSEGSPAEKAGLQRGDIVLEFNREKIRDSRKLQLAVAESSPGEDVALRVLRDGETLSLSVVLGEMPEDLSQESVPASPGGDKGKLGLSIQTIDVSNARELGIPEDITGVIVTGVVPDSASARAGLRRGDVIEEVNRKDITNVQDFIREVQNAGKVVLLLVNREGDTIFVPIEKD